AELGAYGSEINTPAIDSIAQDGIRYTNFYAHSNCSPSRAMLFSGIDSHLAGLGAMHGFQGANQMGQPGYEGYLNHQTVSVAKLLQDANYRTYMTGKWHLGKTEESMPAASGFDSYFAQMGGAPPAGHFNLSSAQPDRNGAYFEDGLDRTGSPVADDFYSSNFYTSKLLDYLKGGENSESPFFAYLAFSAPHIPVQAPKSHIDLYSGKYVDGYDVIRQRRLENMQKLGLVEKNVKVGPRAPTVTPWNQLTLDEQRLHARRMEVYAGAVDNLDDNVGRVLEYLRMSGQLDKTLVLFLSDNGAAGFNGWQSEALVNRFMSADNSLENLGRDGSMMFYGPGWASAGTPPFNLFKRHMAEGGIRVPFIVSGPGVGNQGSIIHEVLTVRDIAPTILEIAGISYPQGSYEGREILPQTGVSFTAQLAGKQTQIHSADEIFGWELFKRRGVRKGDWKASWLESPFGTDQWQLYNLGDDPGEKVDLAQIEPEKLAEMVTAWNDYATENNVIISNTPLVFP
ncbi:MAG: arylsulfatase, partial [Gammaproteobacteria bacterium]|nr:arylsulfatase [Gammaproteobacteria bacterium]